MHLCHRDQSEYRIEMLRSETTSYIPPLLTWQTSMSAPCRGSVRTESVSTHSAVSSAPARPGGCWRGTGAWVSIWPYFIPLLGPPVQNGTLLSAPSVSEPPAEQGQCFLIASESRGCEHALPSYLTQEMCCCTVGKAWGPHCEPCPQIGTGEDRGTGGGRGGDRQRGQIPFSATSNLHQTTVLRPSWIFFFLSK